MILNIIYMDVNMSKKKVLITGSAGFIFSNFVRKAIHQKQPYTFVSIDKINNRFAINDIYINKDHQFYLADITDEHCLDVIFDYEKPNIVIHGAAESHVDVSLKDPNKFIKSNILGTQNIINACLKYKTEKLIYISTDEVYGHQSTELDP